MKNLLLTIFFMLVFKASGQILNERRTMHYGVKDGLSFGVINCLAQDNKGFIWIATSDGLNRFDGHSFKVFKHESENPYSIASNHVQSIFKDSEGMLWVSSRNGLANFDFARSRFIRHHSAGSVEAGHNDDVTHISESGDGNLWVATTRGFHYFNKKTKRFTTYRTDNLKGLRSNMILNIREDSQGILWVGTGDDGLLAFRVRGSKVLSGAGLSIPALHGRIHAIYEDSKRDIWAASSKGLLVYKRHQDVFHLLKGTDSGLSGNTFLTVVENPDKEIYAGVQDGGVYKVAYSGGRYRLAAVTGDNGSPITGWSVQTLFVDTNKNVWLGSYGNGVYLVNNVPAKFKRFQLKAGKDNQELVRFYGMTQDQHRNLWLGTDGKGIYKVSAEGTVLKNYRADGRKGSITDNAILSAFRDSKNRLWFGSYKKGLMLYDPKSDSFKSFSHKPGIQGSLPNNDVRVIFEDSNARLWVGTNGGGLSSLDQASGTFRHWGPDNSGIRSNDVRSIEEDPNGNLWIGTYGGGVNYFDISANRFSPLFADPRQAKLIVNNIVYALHLDDKGLLWIGTEGDGLLIYNTRTKAVTRFTERDGLGNNTIYSIQEEAPGVIWASTNKGLSRIDLKTGRIYNYDEGDGLQAGQFHEGSSMITASKGWMVFGGTEGCNFFHPAHIRHNSAAPEVLITGLHIYGQEEYTAQGENIQDITELRKIELKPDQGVFSVNYLTLDFGFSKETEYAYMLEGLDKTWSFVKNQRYATYRYLEPGSYTFKVKAANENGVWAEDFSSIDIVVLPPWYKTWWAYLAYLSAGVSLVYVFIRYRTHQAKLKFEIRAAHFEAEKEKELHEKKITFFTNISHEFRTPLTLIINPAKELLHTEASHSNLSNLNTIYRNARRLLSLVDQLLLFRKAESEENKLKPVKLKISSLCQEVYLCFIHQARSKNVSLNFQTQHEGLEIFADREKMEIVLFNLISNALKHTPESGQVDLVVSEEGDNVVIELKDTGPGIPEEAGDRIFEQFYQAGSGGSGGFGIGLALVKSFVKSHKGSVSYENRQGGGVCFRVSLPKGREHLSNQIIFEEVHETSVFLEELIADPGIDQNAAEHIEEMPESIDVYSDNKRILIVDDNEQIRQYVRRLFEKDYELLEASDGNEGYDMVKNYMPNLVISDIMMQGLSGIELCSRIKEDNALNHIPVILLTASSAAEVRLKGIECGAEDFISKPFERDILVARVAGILKGRTNLQNYFFNHITLKQDNLKISDDYKQFLDRCTDVVEKSLTDTDFNIKTMADSLAMGRSTLYTRIKSISGLSPNNFIRFIRLRKAAEMFITTECTVSEIAYRVGIRDLKYFREQFNKVFGMNPSAYIKKYRSKFNSNYSLRK